MAGTVNKVILLGILGGDPDTKTFNDGGSIVTFSMATSEKWTDKNTDEKKGKTEWHRVIVHPDGLKELVKKYARKGDKIYVEGQIQRRKYKKDGVDQSVTVIVVKGFNGVINLIGRTEKREHQTDAPDDYGSRYGEAPQQRQRNDDLDDEIPF